MLSHSVMSNSLRPHGLQFAKLCCPWNFPGKNTGMGCHFLLHGEIVSTIYLTSLLLIDMSMVSNLLVLQCYN